ncbi:MAG TPA: hypothetical protein VFV03_00340 [Solirubrobacteraceae bacterium]|nr:hypothetical protein [Solirubrobacteraceae bacterium]
MSIVLQAAEAQAEEVEGRHHDDATIAKSESIRVAVTRLRTPAKVDVRLLRQQRDWLLNLQADSPAELGRMVQDRSPVPRWDREPARRHPRQ